MYTIETSKDNLRIAKIKINGKEKYLGSYYNHKRDIDKFIKSMGEICDNTVIITYGLTDGEYLLELSKIKEKTFKIIVFEKDEELIKKVANDEYYDNILKDKRIKVFKYDEKKIKSIFNNELNLINVYNVKVINNPLIYDASKEMLYISQNLKNFMSHIIINNNTINYFSERWFESFIKNFKYTLNSIFLDDIENKFKNKPAIILSAGPSLEKNITLLKECNEEFIIISGGRTLSKLEQINVKPDLIAIIDGDERSYDLVKNNLNIDTPLIFCNYTNEKILINHNGKKIYDSAGVDFIGPIVKKEQQPKLKGGSVAHACINTAIHLGCNPIVFIGQDLAYTNDKVHANFCEFTNKKYKSEEVLENIISENDIFIDDIYGNKVRTSLALNAFREKIEDIIRENENIRFINATEGGALINGAEIMMLKDVISLYGNDKIKNKVLDLNPTLKQEERTKVIDEFKKSIKYLKDIKVKCSNLIDLNKKLKIKYNKKQLIEYDKISAKMDVLEEELKKLYLKVDYIRSLIYPIVMKVELNDVWIIKDSDNEKEKFKKLYDKTEFLYSTMKKKVEYALNFIDKEWNINEL